MKCFKRSALLRSFALLLSVATLAISSVGSYASTTTESGSSSNDDWQMTAYRFLELAFTGYAKEISAPFVIWRNLTDPYSNTDINATTFMEWEHEHGLDIPLNEYFVKGTHGGGHARDSQKINNSTSIEVPEEVAQEVLTYIQVCVQANPLSYKQCYISSYNYLPPSYFGNYTQYSNFIEIMKNADLTFFHSSYPQWNSSGYNKYLMWVTVDRSKYDVNFYGTTVGGVFTSVSLERNWANLANFPEGSSSNGIVWYFTEYNSTKIGHGNNIIQAQQNYYGYDNLYRDTPTITGNVKNNTGLGLNNTLTVYTGKEHDELVYVFDTLNAYKNYNSGSPQPYYLTEAGFTNSNWNATDGIINTGSMLNSGNYYNYIIDNSSSGMTPDQVLKLIEMLLEKIDDGSFEGGSDDKSTLWEALGNAIGNLIEGIFTAISKVIEAFSSAINGVLDQLLGENGIISKLTGMVSGSFNSFLTAVFGWLPEEIVTLFSATLVFGIFFAIFKMIRR